MSKLVDYLKEILIAAIANCESDWKPMYPNNMPCNRISGYYKDMNFRNGDTYTYFKFTIEYKYRCDITGLSHPEEGIKYYVLHTLRVNDLPTPITIPKPTNHQDSNSEGNIVNNNGHFRYVFEDMLTAKKVVRSELLCYIYPFLHILKDEERTEWNDFVKDFDLKALYESEKKAYYETLYPVGTKLMLTAPIDDPYSPKAVGDIMTVSYIDDANQIHGQWKSGGCLALVIGHDKFVKIE